jgi:uncharacterized glyoxalase superfamily protein PhnB
VTDPIGDMNVEVSWEGGAKVWWSAVAGAKHGEPSLREPMQETFFATRFGQLRDRFGLNWMITHERPMPPTRVAMGDG